ncbi:MAG: U32 family peptidase [Spirochaetes bacterium]|jgi:putative protease|nr:U32 family peptidase [Spirochaetota bacterium]
MTNCEIVAPGGSLEKLKFAVLYGAHSVYFGGDMFNLRDKSRNFSADEIEEAVKFCAAHGVKTTFLLNSFVHEGDINQLRDYIASVEHHPFDAVMISDPATLEAVQDSKLNSRIYLSTQMSTLNHLSANFWQRNGVSRIVLARETTLDDIKRIRDATSVELEIFAHGAVCISYSGRCLLSRYLSGRDANQGACSHPCRWNFALVEEKRPGFHLEIIEHKRDTHILSSKDLCLIHKLQQFKEAGVNAFKLEGRMKSLYYAANVTRIYRHALENPKLYDSFKDFYSQELDMVSHRPYTEDLFNEFDDMENRDVPYIKNVMFLGYSSTSESTDTPRVKVFNPIRPGDTVEVISPLNADIILDTKAQVLDIQNIETGIADNMARPNSESLIHFDAQIPANSILRKKQAVKE